MKQYTTCPFSLGGRKGLEIGIFVLDEDGKKYAKRCTSVKEAREFTAELEANGFVKVRRFQYSTTNPCAKAQMI